MLLKRMIALLMLTAVSAAACAPQFQSQDSSSEATVVTATLSTRAALPETSGLALGPARTEASGDPTPTRVPCPTNTPGPALDYEIEATLDWPARTLEARQQVRYRNETGRTLREIVFSVPANHEPDQFRLTRVTLADGRPLSDYELAGERLTVPLLERLHAHCAVGLVLEFDLALPALEGGYSTGSTGYRLGYWGYSERQVNLGLWLPLVAAYAAGEGWITPRHHAVGEQTALPAADFVLELAVEGASDKLRVAGPGVVRQPDDGIWRFELTGAREITLSISEAFQMLSTLTTSDVAVELYYFDNPQAASALNAPRHALLTAADALALYEELFGPYPYPRVVVVQGDFPDGMEFSGLVFVGDAWFKIWGGGVAEWLTVITAHEIAHQWWYAQVGSDQGRHPYLDEALSIYCEMLFFERYYPENLDWWWDFRVRQYEPAGYVDAAAYDFYSVRDYINAIYLRGALMIEALRDDLGDEVFLAWLRQYAGQGRGRIMTPADLWSLLPDSQYRATEATRRAYLRQPDILPELPAVSEIP